MSKVSNRGPELLAVIGSIAAVVAVFLPWYRTDPASPASNIDGVRGELSMWTVHEAMRYVLLVHLVLLVILTVATLLAAGRRSGLHEPIMVLAVNAIGIIVYFGFIFRPGEPMATISLEYGCLVALAGSIPALAVSAVRSSAGMRRSASPIGARA